MFRKKQEESRLRRRCFQELQDMQPLVSWFQGSNLYSELHELPNKLEQYPWHAWWQEDTYTALESFAKRLENVWDALVKEGVYVEDSIVEPYSHRIASLREEERVWRGKIEEAWGEWSRIKAELPQAYEAGRKVVQTYTVYPESFPLTLLKLEHAKDGIAELMMTNPLSPKRAEIRTLINTFLQECEMFKELWDEINMVFREAEEYERYRGWVKDREVVEYPRFKTEDEVMNDVLQQKMDYYMKEEAEEEVMPLSEEDVLYLEKKQNMLFAIQRGAYQETRIAIANFRNELEVRLYDMHSNN